MLQIENRKKNTHTKRKNTNKENRKNTEKSNKATSRKKTETKHTYNNEKWTRLYNYITLNNSCTRKLQNTEKRQQ